MYEYHCNYSYGKEVEICGLLLVFVLWLILLNLNWKSSRMEEESLFPFLLWFQILIVKPRLLEHCPCDISTISSHSYLNLNSRSIILLTLKCGMLAGLLKSSKKEEESLFPLLLWFQILINLRPDLWSTAFMISASVLFIQISILIRVNS